MDLRLGYDVFDGVAAEVGDAIINVSAARRRAGGEVAWLLDGGWTGAAARSFAAAWQDWCEGADQVEAALSSIAAGLAASRRELTVADGEVADSHHLLGRLV